MGNLLLGKNGEITNSLRFKEVSNKNILRCLTERIHSLEDGFSLHSVYLLLDKYPMLCNILDTPSLYSPIDISPVRHFKSFFNDYRKEPIGNNFLKTAKIHQLIVFSKSDYEFKFGDISNIHKFNEIKPSKIESGYRYSFDNQYEMSLDGDSPPSIENDFFRTSLSKNDIESMNHRNPIKLEIGNILYFYSDSRLLDGKPTSLTNITESGQDAISITLLNFLETIINHSIMIR